MGYQVPTKPVAEMMKAIAARLNETRGKPLTPEEAYILGWEAAHQESMQRVLEATEYASRPCLNRIAERLMTMHPDYREDERRYLAKENLIMQVRCWMDAEKRGDAGGMKFYGEAVGRWLKELDDLDAEPK